jgi:uncharacterized OsmC-like protein
MSQVREAIEKLAGAIAADPSKAQAKRAPATARLVDGLRCEITGPYAERVATDMPPAIGGAGSAPSPGWLFRGALASCTATVIAMRAAKLGVALKTLEVTVETDSDHRGMLGLDETVSAGMRNLRMKVRIAGDASPDALREIAAWADAHSPVGCTVRNAPASLLEVELVEG